jgi:hypothetical protein
MSGNQPARTKCWLKTGHPAQSSPLSSQQNRARFARGLWLDARIFRGGEVVCQNCVLQGRHIRALYGKGHASALMPPPQPPPYAKTRATPYREQTSAFAGRPIVVRDTHSHAAYRELTTSSQEHWPLGHLGLTTVAEDLAGKTGRSAGKQNDTSMALGKPAHEQAKGRGSKISCMHEG